MPWCRSALPELDLASVTSPRARRRRGSEAPLSSPIDGALARLMTWAYQHASADKLAIARESLAHELPPGIEVSLASVEQAAIEALEAAKANFALYLHGNTAQYFQLRQQALDIGLRLRRRRPQGRKRSYRRRGG